jgi:hypothetical protein
MKKFLSTLLISVILLAALPLTASAESYYTTLNGDINDAVSAISKQKFKSPLTVGEVQNKIRHFHDSTAHYVKVPNGANSGGIGKDNKYEVYASGMGCLHYANFVSNVIYEYTGSTRIIKSDSDPATADKAKTFLQNYGHAGDHLRVQGSPHSFIFVSAVDSGFYTLQYYGDHRDPFFSFYSYADFATTMNKYPGNTVMYYNSNLTLENNASTFTIVYNSNGGTGSMENTVVTHGTYTATRTNTFKKAGYSFTGWFVQRKSDGKWRYHNPNNTDQTGWYTKGSQPAGWKEYSYSDGQPVSATVEIGDTATFYAQWTLNTFNIVYDANGGEGTMDGTTPITYGVDAIAEANTFTREDFTFNGWQAQRESDGKWYYQNQIGDSGWYAKNSQPTGWTEVRFADEAKISEIDGVKNDTVILKAQWKSTSRLPGDADDNSDITATDATLILRYLFWTGVRRPIINESNADVDGDSAVSAKDATTILRHLFWTGDRQPKLI